MNKRILFLAAASIAAVAPSLSHAAPESAALNACARAFASSIAAPGTSSPAYKLKYLSDQAPDALSQYYGHEYTFYLQAHDPKTGLALARATCYTNFRGTTVSLTATPLEVSAPTLAAQLQ
jgi:hypothetical protein